MRLTWKREERERGLAGVVQGERGYDLRVDSRRIGSVRRTGRLSAEGWFWYVGDDALSIPYRNTCKAPAETIEEAKAQCMAYVKDYLAIAKGD